MHSPAQKLDLEQEAGLPAARVLVLGPLQKATGPGGDLPSELGEGQGPGMHGEFEGEEPAASGRSDIENAGSFQVHRAQGREEHTPPIGAHSRSDRDFQGEVVSGRQ